MNEHIDWSKAPAGATHYYPATCASCVPLWLLIERGRFLAVGYMDSKDWALHYTTSQPELDMAFAVARPKQWNGPEEGLPPVGVKVTIENPQGYGLICDQAEWLGPEVTVVHTYRNLFGVYLVVVERDDGAAQVFRGSMCRPIRTAEQPAAEEREAAIRKMEQASGSHLGSAITRVICERLYDAGARMPGEGSKA